MEVPGREGKKKGGKDVDAGKDDRIAAEEGNRCHRGLKRSVRRGKSIIRDIS